MKIQCGYIGLGAMGQAMAGHIANYLSSKNQPPLKAYNRTITRTQALQKTHPIQIATTLQDLIDCDIIFCCLLNDTVVSDTIQTLIKLGLKPGSLLVESSTISPELANTLAETCQIQNVTYLACPIVGPPIKAISGDLTVLIAGGKTKEVQDQVLSFLIPVIGKKVIRSSLEEVGKALELKLCANFFVTSVVEMVSEGLTLGEASGVGQDKVKEVLDCVFPDSLLSIYASRMVNNTYRNQIAFPISGAKKDVGHILKLAQDHNVQLPITNIFLENANKVQQEQGDLDLSAVVGVSRQNAGLDFDLKKKEK